MASDIWTNVGDYLLTASVVDADHPEEVSTNLLLQVAAIASPLALSNNFEFDFEMRQ